MARLATSAAHFCQRLQELYPQKLQITAKQQSEQSSPFRRWTTGSGAGSSYRHHDHRNMYNKQMSEGSSPVSHGGGGANVARWSLGLEHLLADPAGAAAFEHFLDKEFATENIHFWLACEQYRTSEASARGSLAGAIWTRHLAAGADEAVNVDAVAIRHAALLLCQDSPPADLFAPAQNQIFNLMKLDSYPRFLRSATHAECARAGLCGLPPPYAAQSAHKPNNLKKSASNASERRRSGGASLLARLRPASRERQQQSVTDVVKSCQPGLCRVLLPDGATSVVSVDGGATVEQLVGRLLQKRNLTCSSYDVMWHDPKEGEAPCVELSQPSSVLGGREALVERRAMLRLEVAGAGGARCVVVRCGGARSLQHVLRRVAHRYRLAPLRAHRAGAPLHPDTLMQELDGCRVQVSECEGGAGPAPVPVPDSDADSLCELALRQDERDHDRDLDTQSVSTTSSRSTGVGGPASGGGPGGARVRAAVRPGAPLHHHPPDFLDNLRETQRARALSKDPMPGGPLPALQGPPDGPPGPRAAPPLPPKPAPRPTVV